MGRVAPTHQVAYCSKAKSQRQLSTGDRDQAGRAEAPSRHVPPLPPPASLFLLPLSFLYVLLKYSQQQSGVLEGCRGEAQEIPSWEPCALTACQAHINVGTGLGVGLGRKCLVGRAGVPL